MFLWFQESEDAKQKNEEKPESSDGAEVVHEDNDWGQLPWKSVVRITLRLGQNLGFPTSSLIFLLSFYIFMTFRFHLCFFLFFLGITLVCENTKGEDEDEEPSQELVAGVQLAYSKKKPTRKVIAIL